MKKEKWVVRAAFPNVDGIPYLGNFIESVLSADIFARYLRSKGAEVVFISRSEKVGTPNVAAAKAQGLEPNQLTDRILNIINLFEKWEISFDNYARTHYTGHTEYVQDFYQKFSQSYDIGIRIDEALELAPVDYWRYCLIISGPELRDGSFSLEDFVIMTDFLYAYIGDFIHRTLTFIYKRFSGRVPERVDSSNYEKEDIDFIQAIQETPKLVTGLIESLSFKSALEKIEDLVRTGYNYLSLNKPWHQKAQDDVRIGSTLNLCIQCVRTLAILLSPFIPKTSQKIWNLLGISGKIEKIKWSEASNLAIISGYRIKKPQRIFPSIYLRDMENKLRTIRKKERSKEIKQTI